MSEEDADEIMLLALVFSARAAIKKEANAAALPSLRQLGLGLDLLPQRTRKHPRIADPVGFVDDAQAVGVAVGDEDAEGEGGCMDWFNAMFSLC